MKSSLVIFAGLFVFSLFLTPMAPEKKEITVTYSLPEVKKTEEIIKETELYHRLEVVEAKITETENAINQRFTEKPNGEILTEVRNDSIHVCPLHPISYHNDSVGDFHGNRN